MILAVCIKPENPGQPFGSDLNNSLYEKNKGLKQTGQP